MLKPVFHLVRGATAEETVFVPLAPLEPDKLKYLSLEEFWVLMRK